MNETASYPYAYLHHDDCGGIAFYLSRKQGEAEVMRARDALLANGIVPESGTPVICGNCGRDIWSPSPRAIVAVR